jgi:iron complex outermembrane receptor protein
MLFAFFASKAQPQLTLPEFELIDSTKQGLAASYALTFDSLQRNHPLQRDGLVDLLAKQSPIHLKNYGPGLLATPTFRGGDANHTQVLWNGFPINSPMLGTMDLNTLSGNQFNRIQLLGGNASNLFSTGGLGGSIALQQAPSFDQGYSHAYSGIGSFRQSFAGGQTNLPFTIGKVPAVFGFTSAFNESENAFPFVDISEPEQPQRILESASFGRTNVSTQFGIAPTSGTRVQAIYWYNSMDRWIPAPINTQSGGANQLDEVHRAMLEGAWNPSNSLSLAISSFYEQNSNRYVDTNIQLDNDNRYQQFQQQLRFAWNKDGLPSITGNLRHQYILANSENYSDQQAAQGISAVVKAGYRLWKRRIQLEAGYRFEQFMTNQALLPFGGMQLRYAANAPWALFISASETARFPTINERFWNPGGNPDLSAERAENYEGGLQYESNGNRAAITFYQVNYQDRIRWLPYGTLFTPTNVNEARTQGVEASAQWVVRWSQRSLRFHVNATQLNAVGRNEPNDEWQRLSFIPNRSANTWIEYQQRKWSIRYAVQYMGRRFITNDESAYMPHFFLQDLGIQYSHLLQGIRWTWSFGVENMADWNYQVMPWRPMPSRMLTVQFNVSWEE